MKRLSVITAAIAALVLTVCASHAESNVVITAFEGNGELTFTQIDDATEYAVEWASSLDGPWTNTWTHLTGIPTNPAPTITVAVPMFYRVVATVIPPTGSVQVTLAPAGAVSAGAQWSVDDGATWHNSGVTVTGLPTGGRIVTFKAVAGWDTPIDQGIVVNKNQTTTTTGTYVQQTGSLNMTLTPAGARTAGAQWSIDGGTIWRNSATTTVQPIGTYTVIFKDVLGYATPSSQSKDILKDQTTTGTAEYTVSPPPDDMVLVSGGTFTMGDTEGDGHFSNELPTHQVTVSSFYMSKYLISKSTWDEVYTWAETNGYVFNGLGYDNTPQAHASTHPVYNINWYDMLKWCNARSEKEGRTPCYYTTSGKTTPYRSGQVDMQNNMVNWSANGYRLPTEAEWEYAARGGHNDRRFPWGDLINHSHANYYSTRFLVPYDNGTNGDTSIADRRHPAGNPSQPCTTPVSYFATNDYGLHDMVGNMWEYVWDRHDTYPSSAQTDPHGPTTGDDRVQRGGHYDSDGRHCRVARRSYTPALDVPTYGECFRIVIGQ